MGRFSPNLAAVALLLVIGVATLTHFASMVPSNVRAVVMIGLSGGGAACGAALFGLIFAIATRSKH